MSDPRKNHQNRKSKAQHRSLPRTIHLALLIFLLTPCLAIAQSKGGQAGRLSKALSALNKAQKRYENDSSIAEARKFSGDTDLSKKLQRAATRPRDPEPSPEMKARNEKAEAMLKKAEANLSEEGLRRLQRKAPITAQVSAPTLKAKRAPRVALKEKDKTIIKTGPEGTGIFDGTKNLAIFADESDGVVLDNARINITCEELEVHFKEDSTPPSETENTGGAAKTIAGGNNIEVAYARGKRVILQKKHADGKIQIGQCREAVYDGKTGDLILKIWPQIQENEHLIIATAASTRIIILPDGRLKFVGPTETRVSNE